MSLRYRKHVKFKYMRTYWRILRWDIMCCRHRKCRSAREAGIPRMWKQVIWHTVMTCNSNNWVYIDRLHDGKTCVASIESADMKVKLWVWSYISHVFDASDSPHTHSRKHVQFGGLSDSRHNITESLSTLDFKPLKPPNCTCTLLQGIWRSQRSPERSGREEGADIGLEYHRDISELDPVGT